MLPFNQTKPLLSYAFGHHVDIILTKTAKCSTLMATLLFLQYSDSRHYKVSGSTMAVFLRWDANIVNCQRKKERKYMTQQINNMSIHSDYKRTAQKCNMYTQYIYTLYVYISPYAYTEHIFSHTCCVAVDALCSACVSRLCRRLVFS